jgi:serine/threonine protein kinase
MINNGIYKIADFGFSKVIEIVPIINNVSTKGTPLYMAP